MDAKTIVPTYHVLLIGIDRYPGYNNSLSGCVNDIDAIEKMLLDPPGIGIPAEQIRVTRLAAPRPDRPVTSRFETETLAPTRANLVQSLKALAGPEINDSDRVLIYYSGHGHERQWEDSKVWHEALVPHNDAVIEYLFDVEINGLINAIAARSSDLTVVLDCCHSAGATRDLSGIDPQGTSRVLKTAMGGAPVAPPDLAALGLEDGGGGRGVAAHLLQSPDPDYLVVVACQSDEKAKEGAHPSGQPCHGVFTHSLLNVLSGKDATQRAGLRWADIWPELLANAAERNAQLKQRPQHPWMIGRSERKVFGGAWEKADAGYRVTRRPDGDYEVGAGSLMGVTEGAEIAVYGSEPRLFPVIGSREDMPIGRLKVSNAGQSAAVAVLVGPEFDLEGARGRLVKPGASQRLRVSLKPEDAGLRAQLERSPLLQVVSSTDADAEVEVITQPDGTWIIGEEEPLMAIVPPGETRALRAGLEHLYRYNTVLRMAHNCSDIKDCLIVQLLDCGDEAALAAMSAEQLADPALPESPRDEARIYSLQPGSRFCVKVTNSSSYRLNVTLLNCSAGGLVEYLGDATLRERATQVMWFENKLGEPFGAQSDDLPSGAGDVVLKPYTMERMIAIGTTRPDSDLGYLRLDQRVQQVVNANFSRGGERPFGRPEKTSAAPAELWTATVIPIRIARQ
jgi:hypothetical protein